MPPAVRQARGAHYATVIWDRHYSNEDAAQYRLISRRCSSQPGDERYIVVSDIRSMSAELDTDADRQRTEAINGLLKKAYPGNFLDLTQVLDDPATRSDGLHLTQAGIDIVAEQPARFITEKGW